MRRAILFSLFLAITPRADAAPYATVRIEGVPHVAQRPDFCGEACAEMVLRKLGFEVTQDQVFDLAGVNPALGRGAWTPELARALRTLGFETGPIYRQLEPGAVAEVEAAFATLHEDLVQGVPSIVCMYSHEGADATEHFRLVLGYEAATDAVLYHEPAEEDGAYRAMSRELFLRLWPLKGRTRWSLIRLRLERPISAARPPLAAQGKTSAAFAQHVLSLKGRLGRGYTFSVEPPFVVVGDEASEKVARRAQRVRWVVKMLRQDFFDRDPESIIDVFVFKDRASYFRHARALFGDVPSTPLGYFSAEDDAVLVNIKPGDGTLVHELVHPFVQANLPDCPPWIDEGLASLYEYPRDVDGHLHGDLNWRLPILQQAIRKERLLGMRELVGLDPSGFYEDPEGAYYAQARYLFYYLQQKGLLVGFMRGYAERRAQDPTGLATLQKVLGEQDLKAFEKRWRAWVMTLRR